MKTIHRSYKVRLYPTKDQEVLLSKFFGSVRFVYNYFLNQRKVQYQETKRSDNYYQQHAQITRLKKQEETKWLKEVDSQSIQYALRCLDTAYVRFFRGVSKFPRFKSKKDRKDSFSCFRVIIDDGKLVIPKFKQGFKFKGTQPGGGRVVSATISKTPTNKYFASILVEEEYQPKEKTGATCGIDLGIKDFVVTSDGQRFKNNQYTKQYEVKLAKAQRHLSRKTRGSNGYEKQRLKVAKVHEKITNSRRDNLHKVSHQLVSMYDTIALEDLNVKKMMGGTLAKHIADVSWGTFVGYIKYKADWNDKQIVQVNRFYPSSKTCSECGWINQNLNLSTREWTCANGHVLDRDLNAAKNILREGINLLSSRTDDYVGGDSNKTSAMKHKSLKPIILLGE